MWNNAIEKQDKEEEFLAARKKAAEEEEAFKAKLFKELDIEEHPKKDVLYRIAWDLGHAYGFDEVRSYAQDLVELIK